MRGQIHFESIGFGNLVHSDGVKGLGPKQIRQ